MPLEVGLVDDEAFKYYSLDQFNDMCTALTQGHKFTADGADILGERWGEAISQQRMASYALTGMHPDTDVQTQLSITDYEIPNNDSGLSIRRDYDSLFLVTKTSLPYSKPVHFFTRQAWDHRILDDVKFKARFRDRNGVTTEQAFKKIPQVVLGTADERHLLVLMLPNAITYDGNAATNFQHDDATNYHNRFVLEVMRDGLPGVYSSRIPLNETAERFRTQRRNGTFVQSTFDLPGDVVSMIGAQILEKLNEIPEGKEAFFFHTIKGAKGTASHANESRARRVAFQQFATHFDVDRVNIEIERGDSYGFVDVALELQGGESYVVAAKRTGHIRLIRTLTGMSDHQANKVANNSSIFRYDSFAQIGLLAGFGLTLDPKHNNHGAVFLQVYHTEKSRLYLKDGGKYAKHVTCTDVLKSMGTVNGEIASLEGMKSVYLEAYEANLEYPARVEIRVPWQKAREVWGNPDTDVLNACFVRIPGDVWWTFKGYRLAGARIVLSSQISGSRETWASLDGIALTAAVVYLVNGLNSRPDDSNEAIDIATAVIPHAHLADEDIFAMDLDFEVTAAERYNLFFIRQISFFRGAHLSRGRLPQIHSLTAFFNTKQIADLTSRIRGLADWRPKRSMPGPTFIPNKQKRTAEVELVPEADAHDFHLGEDITLPTRIAVHPVGYHLGENANPPHPDQQTVNAECQTLMNQFFADIVAKAPNTEGQKSYWKLDVETRTASPRNVFERVDLLEVFTKCSVLRNTDAWENAKNSLFPGANENVSSTSQGYKSMVYFQRYMSIKKGFEGKGQFAELKTVRQGFHNVLDTLVWLPGAKKDRPWSTKKNKGKFLSFENPNTPTAAPIIVINPKYPHIVDDIIRDINTNAGAGRN